VTVPRVRSLVAAATKASTVVNVALLLGSAFLTVASGQPNTPQPRDQNLTIEASAVPAVIVSLAAVSRLDPASLEKVERQGRFGALLGRLEVGLGRLACDCVTRLVFSQASYVTRADVARQPFQQFHDRGAPGGHRRTSRSELFILEATDVGGETAMMLMSDSPRRVTIVGVDSELDARLIYDSFAEEKDDLGRAREPLFDVAAISVTSRGVVQLVEPVRPDGPDRRDRALMLDMNGPRITLIWKRTSARVQ
jgi:hypothetical protein